MGIFSWLCLGILSGLILNRILVLQGSFLKVSTIVIAVTGALLGGFVGIRQGWGWGDITSFNIRSFSASLVGCAVMAVLYVGILVVSRSRNHHKIL